MQKNFIVCCLLIFQGATTTTFAQNDPKEINLFISLMKFMSLMTQMSLSTQTHPTLDGFKQTFKLITLN